MVKKLPTEDPGLTAFDRWLEACGAVRAANTNEYEVRRWQTALGHLILYRNARDERKWVAALGTRELAMIRAAHSKGTPLSLGLVAKTGRKAKQRPLKERQMDALLTRQFGECFYCGCLIAHGQDRPEGVALASFEHMVPLNKGGPDTLDNLVAACEPCNRDAGSLSVYEKVLLRERRFPYAPTY